MVHCLVDGVVKLQTASTRTARTAADSWLGPCESTEHTWVFPLQGAKNSRVRQHFYQVLRVYKGDRVHADWCTMPLYGNKGYFAFIIKMLMAAGSELLLTLSVQELQHDAANLPRYFARIAIKTAFPQNEVGSEASARRSAV